MSETREVARRIRLPFPCGCLESHSAPDGLMVIEEHTCDTHLAIDKALQAERERATRVDDDLVFKVLTAARDTALSYDAISGERSGANSVRFAVQDVFTKSGFDLNAIAAIREGKPPE